MHVEMFRILGYGPPSSLFAAWKLLLDHKLCLVLLRCPFRMDTSATNTFHMAYLFQATNREISHVFDPIRQHKFAERDIEPKILAVGE